jgi:hypothetical protein
VLTFCSCLGLKKDSRSTKCPLMRTHHSSSFIFGTDHVLDQPFKLPKMLSGCRVNDDRPVLPGGLELPNAEAVPFEASWTCEAPRAR